MISLYTSFEMLPNKLSYCVNVPLAYCLVPLTQNEIFLYVFLESFFWVNSENDK